MIFKNKPLVQSSLDTDKKHREASTGLDRKSTFYDRTLSQEFKDHFVFIRPEERDDRPRPISSFTNEPSVFYDEKKDKVFSKRFRLKK